MVSKHIHEAALCGILELDGGAPPYRALRNFMRAVADEPVAPEAPAPAPPPPAPQPAKGGKKE